MALLGYVMYEWREGIEEKELRSEMAEREMRRGRAEAVKASRRSPE